MIVQCGFCQVCVNSTCPIRPEPRLSLRWALSVVLKRVPNLRFGLLDLARKPTCRRQGRGQPRAGDELLWVRANRQRLSYRDKQYQDRKPKGHNTEKDFGDTHGAFLHR